VGPEDYFEKDLDDTIKEEPHEEDAAGRNSLLKSERRSHPSKRSTPMGQKSSNGKV